METMGWKSIFCFFACSILPAATADYPFTIKGNITLGDPQPPYRVGDVVAFNFSLRLEGDENVTGLSFTFMSETLKFLPSSISSIENQTSWLYNKAEPGGSYTLEDRGSGSLIFSETYNRADDSISVSFPFRGWGSEDLDGQLKMIVRDGVGAGRKLQCKAKISYFVVSANSNVNREILSDYTFTVMPMFALNFTYPTYLKVLERTPMQIILDLPEGSTEAALEVVMPLTETDDVAKMSVKSLVLDSHRSIPDADVASLTPSYIATTGESVNDIGVMSPISVSVNGTDSAGNEMEFAFSAELEMYPGIENGSELWVGGGVKFGDTFLWVAEVPVYVLDNYDRRPLLRQETVFLSQYGHDGTMMATLETTLSHEDNSTDHAYDITMVIYLMPCMTSTKIVSAVHLGSHRSTSIGNRFEFSIDKIRTDITPSLQYNISFDVGDEICWRTDTFIVITELFYGGGYRNSTEWSNHLQHVTFNLNKTEARTLTYTDGATCVCDFDNTRSDCGCCKPGGCQCGTTNPQTCVDCSKMWRCGPHIQGYDKESRLGGEYLCRAYQLQCPSSSGISCFREYPVNTWTNLQPTVGLILGQDTSTDTLYGIANNGDGYVISNDQGLTWASIHGRSYVDAVNGGSFVNATLTSY